MPCMKPPPAQIDPGSAPMRSSSNEYNPPLQVNAPTTGGYDMRPLDAGTLTVSLTPAEH